ncbi:MAG: hypothetical protein C0508_21310, partial [Cyanobacteria bacterium PR.023]|nr:hypothetical protein [Cyanobacteria bacterium PR.023]
MRRRSDKKGKNLREELVILFLSLFLLTQVCAAQGKNSPGSSSQSRSTASPLRLRGQVSELMMLCNAAGLSLDDSRLPGVVTKVRLGSPAAVNAIVEGDKILRASLQDKMLTLDIERRGMRYQTKFEIR